MRQRRGPTLTLSRKSDRLTALRRSSPLPTGEGARVRVHEPKRLRPLTQEAVDEGGLAGAVGSGEDDEGGHRFLPTSRATIIARCEATILARQKIADVFKTVGQPTVTYVKRDSGSLEQLLTGALNEAGQLCLVTGPSKTGKTTLYREVLSQRGELALIVRCDSKMTANDVWLKALEEVDFDRIQSRTKAVITRIGAEAEIGGKLNWTWLAETTARFKGLFSKDMQDSEIRTRVLSAPGPDLLIPILKDTAYTLVVEDFHYLQDDEKVALFQQWKRFVDQEVSVVVLSTTHRSVDIANSNKDLIGRVAHIDVGHWDVKDLELIAQKGFDHIRVGFDPDFRKLIASEAVGLPIIVQQACLALFQGKTYTDEIDRKKLRIDKHSVEKSLHHVARVKYQQFDPYYATLIRGPREKARKYKTYELVLACFTLDPIKFCLHRKEIDERLIRLQLPADEMPPFASLNSTLGALKKFQMKREFELLEWRPNEDMLYIIEPAFLFFVRWRTIKEVEYEQLDLFEQLISKSWNQVVISANEN